ncbi:hypothetical protein ABZU75_44720 [Streptosporangium sp. NPDC005286]|uniref:hypothetical protein n=1 Tax=Streptosporangium sp. NPDC005286 TaxID=3154463 RepID=UPI0033BE910F
MMTNFFDVLLAILPLTAFGNALYRAAINPASSARIFRTAFLASGVVLLILALIGSVRLLGRSFATTSDTLDIAVKAGFGMMLGALVCAMIERKDHASGGGTRLRDDRHDQSKGS